MKLRSGKSKEIQQEGMGRKRKAPIHVWKKQNSFIPSGKRFIFPRRRKATAMARDQTFILVSSEHLLRDDGLQPFLCRHGSGEAAQPQQRKPGKRVDDRRQGKIKRRWWLRSMRGGRNKRMEARAKGEESRAMWRRSSEDFIRREGQLIHASI